MLPTSFTTTLLVIKLFCVKIVLLDEPTILENVRNNNSVASLSPPSPSSVVAIETVGIINSNRQNNNKSVRSNSINRSSSNGDNETKIFGEGETLPIPEALAAPEPIDTGLPVFPERLDAVYFIVASKYLIFFIQFYLIFFKLYK